MELSKIYEESKNIKINFSGKKIDKIRQEALENLESFWHKQAKELVWFKDWDKPLDWNPPYAKWFTGGKINASVNCLDKHVNSDRKNKVAIIWEGENGDSRSFTYYQLYIEVNRFANALKNLGIVKGDRITIYLPMIPELIIAMLACARIGAIHNVVFSGFSSQALADRINDAKSKIIITSDGGYRRGKFLELKKLVDRAVQSTPSIKNVVILKRTDNEINLNQNDVLWTEIVKGV
ncbi:MAG: acetyl-coenzyme A synthetase, partial [Nitrososphaeraceae archaeon]|nr:acetyl-coenzyme A synthetase [Nitrososphaeraceae archaeon]